MNSNTVPLYLEALPQDDWLQDQPLASVESSRKPELQLVEAPRKKGLGALAGSLTAVAVILVTLFAQLGLSIAVSEGAYEARALQLELRDLTRVERVLSQNAAKLASPQNLAVNAAQLGMVQNTTPATLRLSDGAVLGTLEGPTAAVATNTVSNVSLEGLPIVDADGLLVDRDPEQAVAAAATQANTPVPWEGALPAPQTH